MSPYLGHAPRIELRLYSIELKRWRCLWLLKVSCPSIAPSGDRQEQNQRPNAWIFILFCNPPPTPGKTIGISRPCDPPHDEPGDSTTRPTLDPRQLAHVPPLPPHEPGRSPCPSPCNDMHHQTGISHQPNGKIRTLRGRHNLQTSTDAVNNGSRESAVQPANNIRASVNRSKRGYHVLPAFPATLLIR